MSINYEINEEINEGKSPAGSSFIKYFAKPKTNNKIFGLTKFIYASFDGSSPGLKLSPD